MARLAALLLILLAGGCAQSRTDALCKKAVEERTKNQPPGSTFQTARFLEGCKKLPPADAQCTVPSFSGSAPVLASKECQSAYRNPDFPRDAISGTTP